MSRDVRVRSLGDREGLAEVTFADEVLRGRQLHGDLRGPRLPGRRGLAHGLAACARRAPTTRPGSTATCACDAGASGPRTARLATDIATRAERAGLDSAYDKAQLLQDRLRTMDYSTSVAGLCRRARTCPNASCAPRRASACTSPSTMVMVLRETGDPGATRQRLPARVEHGRGPLRRPASGLARLGGGLLPRRRLGALRPHARRSAAAASRSSPTELAEGEPVASPGPDPAAARRPSGPQRPTPCWSPARHRPRHAGPAGRWRRRCLVRRCCSAWAGWPRHSSSWSAPAGSCACVACPGATAALPSVASSGSATRLGLRPASVPDGVRVRGQPVRDRCRRSGDDLYRGGPRQRGEALRAA